MYNCEKQISRVLSKFSDHVQSFFTEVLVVDNGSKDDSLAAAKQALAKIKNIKTTLVQNNENYSLGGSHKVAFNYAIDNSFDYVIVLHGDDQGSIEDMLPQIESNNYKNYDSLLGSRFHYESKLVGYSLFRTYGNIVFNLFCSLVTGRWITDMGSGLNIYDVNYLKPKFYLYFPNNLTFNVYLLFYGCYVKSKFKFFPLTWKEEDQISNAKVFEQGFIILGLLFEYLFSANKIFAGIDNEYSQIDYSFKTLYSSK